MKKIFILLISIIFTAASCNLGARTNENENQTSDDFLGITEEDKAKFEAYKIELAVICTKPVSTITAVEMAKCKDFKNNELLYRVIYTDKDRDFSFLPEFCKRRVAELTANELADCLKEKTDEDQDNPFQ